LAGEHIFAKLLCQRVDVGEAVETGARHCCR
jgi:hypothetical protein